MPGAGCRVPGAGCSQIFQAVRGYDFALRPNNLRASMGCPHARLKAAGADHAICT
jgi:hypothetical protein